MKYLAVFIALCLIACSFTLTPTSKCLAGMRDRAAEIHEEAVQADERLRQAEEKAKELKERDRLADEISALGKLMDKEISIIAKYQNIGDLRTISKNSKEELKTSIANLKKYLRKYSELCKSGSDCDEEFQIKLRKFIKLFTIND